MHARTSRAAAAASLGLALLLGGCQLSLKAGSTETAPAAPEATQSVVPKADLERQTATEMKQAGGGEPVSLSCSRDLPMQVGATTDCMVTRAGKRYTAKIKVTEANPPTDAKWAWEVGTEIGPAK